MLTLVFPDSLSVNSPRSAPDAHSIPLPPNSSHELLPSTSNPLSPISQDTSLAFSLPYDEASDFLAAIQEIPNQADIADHARLRATDAHEEKRWIMKAAKGAGSGSQGSFRKWARNAWTEFVDLLKVCPPHASPYLLRPGLISFARLKRMRNPSISLSWSSDTSRCI